MATSINSNNQAPWYLDPNDCIGDSLGYINQNAAYTTTLATNNSVNSSINTLTTSFNTLSANVINYKELTSNGSSITTTYTNIFSTGDLLAASARYEVIYDIYGYTAGSAGTAALQFQVLGDSSNIATANFIMTHTTDIGSAVAVNARPQGIIQTSTTNNLNLGSSPASFLNKYTNTQLRLYIKTASSVTINLQVNTANTNTTFTPQAGSYRRLTRVY
jgi:hypothetical protein